MADLHSFDGKEIVSIDAADVELPEAEDKPDEKDDQDKAKANEAPAAGFPKVLELFRSALGDEVAEVRESKRLIDSPCCLVNPQGGLSPQMQRLMKMSNQDFPETKRILEINPKAPLVVQLCKLSANAEHDSFVRECGKQLLANALMLSGLFPDPKEMVVRVQQMMHDAAKTKSPIIH